MIPHLYYYTSAKARILDTFLRADFSENSLLNSIRSIVADKSNHFQRVVARWVCSIDVKSEPIEIRKVLIFKAYSSAIVKWYQ